MIMRINSEDCKMGKCENYPCKRNKCDNELAFNAKGKWFIATPNVAYMLNLRMKKKIINTDLGLAIKKKF